MKDIIKNYTHTLMLLKITLDFHPLFDEQKPPNSFPPVKLISFSPKHC